MKKLFLFPALMFAMAISEAQIPNGGFEAWTSMGSYSNPGSWDCYNNFTGSMGVYTCEQGMPGSQGMYYLKLSSKNVTGLGLIPGVAVSGLIDMMTMEPASGFAFSQRPASLTGKCQHNNSTGYVDVQLTKWNSMMQMRETVGSGHLVFSGSQPGWTAFSVQISYMNGNNPDSCIISLSSSGATGSAADYLSIDDLSFSGTTGIADAKDISSMSVFPNPASSYVEAGIRLDGVKTFSYRITDMQGRLVQSATDIDAGIRAVIDVASLPKGSYIMEITAGKGVYQSRFVKE